MLAHAGFDVVHAAGAQEAITIADKRTPDIVIVEVQLPAHSGIEFLHEFRSYSEWLKVPIIVNTMAAPHRIIQLQEALERDMGVRTILYKPQTSLQDLLRAVREQLAPAS
jgi:DNA-binding response OmpR family regulator